MKEFLKQVNSILPLNPESENALLGVSKKVQFLKQELVQPIGHTCKTIYFVNRGVVRIFYYKDEIDITESFETEGSFVARAESLFTGRPSLKAIQAIEDTELIAIDTASFFKLFEQHRLLESLFRKITEHSYVNTVKRIESLQFHTAEERYLALIQNTPDIVKRIPLKYIASYLGITQVSLSRIRASL